MTDQKLVDELEKALNDEVYDGGMGALSEDQLSELVRTLASTAAKVAEEARTPANNEKLIEEARRLPDQYRAVQLSETQYLEDQALAELDAVGYQAVHTASRLADALEAAEKAHTPTEDEREALVKRLEDEVEYRVRTAVALHKGGHDHEEQVRQGRASVRFLAADFRRSAEPSAECPQPCVHLSQHDAREGRTCAEHPCTCPEPQGEPSSAQEAIRVASPDTWDWDACVVCGSKDVTDRGMMVLFSAKDGVYVSRVAWCDQSQECRDDLRQAGASMLTDQDAKSIDAALRAAGEVDR